MDKAKIKRFFVRIYEKAFDKDIFSSSAQVAFYFLFALFPLLLFLVSIFGIVLGQNNEVRWELFNYLQQLMPNSAYELVYKTMNEVVEGSSSGKITFGLLVSLYLASAGIDSVRIGLNEIYRLAEERSWWKRKLMSLAMTLGLGLMIFFALGVIFYGSQFLNLILGKIGLPISSPFILQVLAVVTVLILLLLTFDLLYYFVPNHKALKWKWVTPGAVVTIILWLLFSKAFGVYLQYFDTYAKTYGSLGAMIILMLWLYLTALVILTGGVINAVLDEFARGKYEKANAGETELESEQREIEDRQKADTGVSETTASEEVPEESHQKVKNELDSAEPEAAPQKTFAKVVAGAIITTVIEIFSFRKNRKKR